MNKLGVGKVVSQVQWQIYKKMAIWFDANHAWKDIQKSIVYNMYTVLSILKCGFLKYKQKTEFDV